MSNKYGSIKELVALAFRKSSQLITLQPKAAASYTADRTIELPVEDTDHELVSTTSTQTLTAKTIDSPVVDTYYDVNEEAVPANPSAGVQRFYVKTDGKLYRRNSVGTETDVEGSAPTASTTVAGIQKLVAQAVIDSSTTGSTLTASSHRWQVYDSLTGSSTCILPSTSILKGEEFVIDNWTDKQLTLQASGSEDLTVANGCNLSGIFHRGYCRLRAVQDTPTNAEHWEITEVVSRWSTGLNGSGAFTGGTIIAQRVGNSVTVRITGGTRAGAQPNIASGNILPTEMRPAADLQNVYFGGTNTVESFDIFTSGSVRLLFWDGSMSARNATAQAADANVTYLT